MAKTNLNNKNNKKKDNKDTKYNAENEIIIGVTTKPKEKVRVEKKTTRTNKKSPQKKTNNKKIKDNKVVSNKKNTTTNKVKNKNTIQKSNVNINKFKNKKQEITSKEKNIRKINRKKIIISSILVLFMALGGTIYYLTTPVFNIQNIEVYGNDKNTSETYISLSKINIGTTNIFAVTNNTINKNIKENPYVEEVTIKRKLPNTLEINIKERKVAYQAEYYENYIYIDSQGYILEINEEKKNVPVLGELESIKSNLNVGERLNNNDLNKLNIVLKVINYCTYNSINNNISSIDLTDPENYIVNFDKGDKVVYLGDASNLSERMSLLKTIFKNEKDKKIEIFMNGELNKDDVYIRYVDK